MLSRLCLSPSTNHTLLIEIEELPIVPVPMILLVWFPPNPQFLPLSWLGLGKKTFLPSSVASSHCPGTRTSAFLFILDTPATSTMYFLGTHIFVGPLGLVQGVLNFLCVLCLKLSCLVFFQTSGSQPLVLDCDLALTAFFL